MRDLNKNFHLCTSALGEWAWGAAKEEERFFQNCQRKFYRVAANFPLFAQFLTHLELLWAVLSLLSLIWALIHIRNPCKEMQAPLFPKDKAQIKQQHLKLKRKFSKAKVMERLSKPDSKGPGSGTVLGLCSWALLPKCRVWSSPAWETGLPTLFWESNPCCCKVLNAVIQKSLSNSRKLLK